MKRKQNKTIITVIIILSVILVLAIGVLITLLACSNPVEPEEAVIVTVPTEEVPSEPAPTEPALVEPFPEETEVPKIQDMIVSTPYCNLYYPGELKDSVRATVEGTDVGCVVKFYGTAGEIEEHIFSLLFAESSENSFPVGVFDDTNTRLDINLELCDISDIEELYVLQEGANYLLDKLNENPAFSSDLDQTLSETTEEEKAQESADFVVKTPYCDLYYPAQWKDAISITEQKLDFGYIVTFHCLINDKKADLFTVFFAEASDDSFPIGIITVDGVVTDVSMELPAIADSEEWSEAEQDLFGKLQENVNYLMDRLKQVDAFEPID